MSVRVMLTLPDSTHELLSELSLMQGIPVATIVRNTIESHVPVFNATLKALTQINQGMDEKAVQKEYLDTLGQLVIKEILD